MTKKKAPKVSDALICLVLDKSGSMISTKEGTLEGVNSLLEEQKTLGGKTYYSLTLFDTTFHARHVAEDLLEVPLLGSAGSPYNPNGGTALLDATGASIQGTEAWLKNNPDFTGKVLFIINTDGEENASTVFSYDAVNALITEKTAQGWEFMFLGSGTAAWTEGRKFAPSIPVSNFTNYANTNYASGAAYASTSNAFSSSRLTP